MNSLSGPTPQCGTASVLM